MITEGKKIKLFMAVFLALTSVGLTLWFYSGLRNKHVIFENNRLDGEEKTSPFLGGSRREAGESIVVEPIQTENSSISGEALPEKIILAVPFLSQAPFHVWDPLHEDACEEASILMLKYFADRKSIISLNVADEEIKNLVAYEESNGYGLSISLEDLEKVSENYLGFKTRIKKNITPDDIKRELASGKPVIVGASGKMLENPNFRNGGPVYHMLVIVGYDRDGFIANDPGTRKGEKYRYTFDNLFSSVRDWDSLSDSLVDVKSYLIVE